MASWQEFETAAPEIAKLGGRRIEVMRVGFLGTLRRDGSPRISPVEPYLSQGQLLFGAMSWSLKCRDLLRDSRCLQEGRMIARHWSDERGLTDTSRSYP